MPSFRVFQTPLGGARVSIVGIGVGLFFLFLAWPVPLWGSSLWGALLLAVVGYVFGRWEVRLSALHAVEPDFLVVLVAFLSFGPGAAALVAALGSWRRGVREGGAGRVVSRAAAATLGVAALLSVYGLVFRDFIFGSALSVLLLREGWTGALLLGVGLAGGGASYLVLGTLFARRGDEALQLGTREFRIWAGACAVLAVMGTLVAVGYPILGAVNLLLLVPVAALSWALATYLRGRYTDRYVGVSAKVMSLFVLTLGVALVVAGVATGAVFYDNYRDSVVARYRALGELTAASLGDAVAAGLPLRANPATRREAERLVQAEPALAYAIVADRSLGVPAALVLKSAYAGMERRIVREAMPIVAAEPEPIAWEVEGRVFAVDHLSVPVRGPEGEVAGELHLGVDRAVTAARVRTIVLVLLSIFTLALAASALVLRRFARASVLHPLQHVSGVMRTLAEGEADLRERMAARTADELGDLARSFNRFMGNLRTIVATAGETGREVSSSAEQLAASAELLSASAADVSRSMLGVIQRLEQEERRLQMMETAVSELARSTAAVAETALASARSSDAVADLAGANRREVERASEHLLEIRDVVQRSTASIGELVSATQQVSELVGAIAGIAEQTDLLALNAAIEASRAGEHGRGFAVVADEVRKLSERSARASDRASGVIAAIRERVDEVIVAMRALEGRVAGVEEVSRAAKEALTQIVRFVAGTAEAIERIATEVGEEAHRVESLRRAVADLAGFSEANVAAAAEVSAATEQQTASTEQIAAGSQQLTGAAARLSALIARFKV